eukprot:375062_1
MSTDSTKPTWTICNILILLTSFVGISTFFAAFPEIIASQQSAALSDVFVFILGVCLIIYGLNVERKLEPRFAWIFVLPLITDYFENQQHRQRDQYVFYLGLGCISFIVSDQLAFKFMELILNDQKAQNEWTIYVIKAGISGVSTFMPVLFKWYFGAG